MTILCRVGLAHAEGATGFPGNLSGIFQQRHKMRFGILCLFLRRFIEFDLT